MGQHHFGKLLNLFNTPEGIIAKQSIMKGIERGDAVADLELLGLEQRTINVLEQSDLEVMTIEQLVACSIEDLNKIPFVSTKQIKVILKCLLHYPDIEKKLKERDEELENMIKASGVMPVLSYG